MTSAAETASAAVDWIATVSVEVDGGQGWREGNELFDDLYSGTAGVLLGCAEASAAGLRSGSLTSVAAGALGRLIHLAEKAAAAVPAASMPDDGLFSGWSGVAVALRAWADGAGDPAARSAAESVCSLIAARILRSRLDKRRYNDVISGDAGILLALLPAKVDAAAPAVAALADRLTRQVEAGADTHWTMVLDWPYLMPGFSHGTAGVAYALAAAGDALDRPDLIELAVDGALTLIRLGDGPNGWAVPLAIPPRPHGPAVNFGWCHGPTGTVRLFLLLDAIDPDERRRPRWRQAVESCLQALRASRLPERIYPGYWDNLGRCCGTAGVGQLLLDRYQATREPDLLAWAETLAVDVIAHSERQPTGIAFPNTEHTRTPSRLAPEPGFMQGAAGIAGWLARLDALRRDPDRTAVQLGVTPGWV